MAKDLRSALAVRNAQLAAVAGNADDGLLCVYGGTRPAGPDTPVTLQPLLSTLGMGSPAFLAPSGGEMFANAIEPDTNIAASGTATWWRLYESDGLTALWDGTVGLADSDMLLDSVDLQAGAILTINSFKLTQP